MTRSLALVSTALVLAAAWPARAQDVPDAGVLDAGLPDAGPAEPETEETSPLPRSRGRAGVVAEPETEPVPTVAPESDSQGDGIDAVVPEGPAPALLKEFEIQGHLIDTIDVVRGFLEPIIAERERWSDTDQKEVIEFLSEIGYHTIIRNQPLPSGGVAATLVLEPVTLIRHVKIDVDIDTLERLINPVFSDEIRRRMNLRPGSALAIDREDRLEQIQKEADRLAFYLRNEGYFEAEIEITERSKGSYASELLVDVDPGPAYTVGKINVRGNTAIETKTIVNHFRQRSCYLFHLVTCVKRFSREQLSKDVDKLVEMYQKRGYPGVRVRTDFDMRHSFKRNSKTVEFSVDVRERRKIDVVFEGNHPRKNPSEELLPELTLSEEGTYDDYEVTASAEALRRYYQRKGYFEASVTWERVRFGVFERIIFTISEGPRLPVREILFHGNEEVARERLAATIKTREFQRFIIGESGGYATSRQIQQDVERLRSLYRGLGYRHSSVRARVARDPDLIDSAPALAAAVAAGGDAEGLYIHFLIDEGRKVEVGEVLFQFQGTPENGAHLDKVIKLRAGEPFLEEVARDDGERIRRHYFSHGYPRAEIETNPETYTDASGRERVRIVHTIKENSPARIGKIALRGNFKTQPWVIRRELGLKEGDKLTLAAAERAQNNLRQSGLFASVKIDYMGFENPRQEVVNVLVEVEERHDNVGVVEVSAGYATDTSGFSEGSYKLQNILGTGARFDTRLLLGFERQLLEGKLALPRWIQHRALGVPFLVEVASFFEIENTERFGDLESIGASLAATKEGREGFFEGWFLSMRYGFRQRVRDEDLVRPAGSSDDLRRSKITTRASTIGPVLVIDRRRDAQGRRNPLTPTRGFRLELRALFGEDFLVGSDRFIKLGTSAQHFLKLGDRFLLSNGLRYDHGIPLGGDVLLPEVERFFAGGDTTVRGFEEDRLATELIETAVPPLGEVEQFRVVPAGGNIRLIHNLELQVRVWDEPPGIKFPIASAIFFDTGLVTNSLDGFEVRDLRHSLGVALARWMTPFGSLSVEYAIPLDPKRGDDPLGRFHVNFGFLF